MKHGRLEPTPGDCGKKRFLGRRATAPPPRVAHPGVACVRSVCVRLTELEFPAIGIEGHLVDDKGELDKLWVVSTLYLSCGLNQTRLTRSTVS